MFGTHTLDRGAVLAIDAGLLYTFKTGEQGGSFINVRAGASEFIKVDRDGAHSPKQEQRMVRKVIPALPHEVAAQL
jgi:hypothetical protein